MVELREKIEGRLGSERGEENFSLVCGDSAGGKARQEKNKRLRINVTH